MQSLWCDFLALTTELLHSHKNSCSAWKCLSLCFLLIIYVSVGFQVENRTLFYLKILICSSKLGIAFQKYYVLYITSSVAKCIVVWLMLFIAVNK